MMPERRLPRQKRSQGSKEALFERESDVDDVPRLVHGYVEIMVHTIESKHALYKVLIDEVPRVSGLAPPRRAAFLQELTDLLCAYALLPRPWGDR